MSGNSAIEWTDATWNPIVGCSIVSPGCTNCYAMKMAARIEAMGNQPRYAGTTRKVNGNAIWTGKLAQAPASALLAPLRRKKPTTYFVNSMGDLFHEDCPDEWIDRVFAVMVLCPQHTFQVLTKRAARMQEYFSESANRKEGIPPLREMCVHQIAEGICGRRMNAPRWPLPNIWLGVSTERQQEADERIPLLLQTPAAVRFISAEPLLGPIDLTGIVTGDRDAFDGPSTINALTGTEWRALAGCSNTGGETLDWVIVGGESGPNARPMHPDWARILRDQCHADGVPFFFKQWGEWSPTGSGNHPVARVGEGLNEYQLIRLGKKTAGRLLDGTEHNGMPA